MYTLDVVPALQRNIPEHVERFDDGHAPRTRGRRSEHFPTVNGILAIADFVFGMKHFADFRTVLREIVERDDAAVARYVVDHDARGFSTVELGGAIFGDALKRSREFRLAQRVARMQHLAVIQENALADRKLLKAGFLLVQ